MLSDDPEAPTTHQEALRLRAADRRAVTGSVVDRRRARSRPLDPRQPRQRARRTDAVDGRTPPTAAAAGASRRRTSSWSPRARSATEQHARGDGPAARLLLPGDRRADRTSRARASRRRASACPGLAMYILIGRTPELRVEPHVGRPRRPRRVRRAALQPRRLARRRAHRPTTSTRASAARSRTSTPARSTARRSSTRRRCTAR